LWIVGILFFPDTGREESQKENQAEALLQDTMDRRILHDSLLF